MHREDKCGEYRYCPPDKRLSKVRSKNREGSQEERTRASRNRLRKQLCSNQARKASWKRSYENRGVPTVTPWLYGL